MRTRPGGYIFGGDPKATRPAGRHTGRMASPSSSCAACGASFPQPPGGGRPARDCCPGCKLAAEDAADRARRRARPVAWGAPAADTLADDLGQEEPTVGPTRRPPFFRSGMTVSMTAWERCSASRVSSGSGRSVSRAWWRQMSTSSSNWPVAGRSRQMAHAAVTDWKEPSRDSQRREGNGDRRLGHSVLVRRSTEGLGVWRVACASVRRGWWRWR